MRLTRYTDYAFRVLIFVGLRHPQLSTIAQMAERYAISHSHLMKVVNTLTREGFLNSVRGKHGGVRLARPPVEINLGALVRLLEPDFALVACFEEPAACAITPACGLQQALHQALQAYLQVLDRYTLADLLGPAQRAQLLPLLQLDAALPGPAF